VIVFILLLLILMPIISAENNTTSILGKAKGVISNVSRGAGVLKENFSQISSGFKDAAKKADPWNASMDNAVTISPTWQKVMGGFFGLNLHGESTEISVREAMVFFMIFIMFLVIILDIIKLTPFFEGRIGGIVSKNFTAALIISILVSITGAFINLKGVFFKGVAYVVNSLNWGWLNYANQNTTWGIIFTMFVVIPIIFLIHELIDWISPVIKKYSQVSKAEAKGRKLGDIIEQSSQE